MASALPLRVRVVRQLYAWHKWTGLITGVFILFLSLTGALAVFRDEIDRAWTPGRSVPARGERVSIDAAMAAVHARYPGRRITYLQWAQTEHDAHAFSVDAPQRLEVFVDPYDGTITGIREGEHLPNVIRQAHVRFYFFGWQGRVVVGLFGVTLLLSSVTGLLIYSPFMKALLKRGLPFWHVRAQRVQWAASDTHKLVGVLTLVFNAVIGVSGAVLGLENLARYAPPALSQTLHPAPRLDGRASAAPDRHATAPLSAVIAAAREAMPGLQPRAVAFPTGSTRHYLVSGDLPSRPTNAGASWAAVALDGRILETHDARRAALATRAYTWMEPLHFGDFAGLWLKMLYCLFGLTSGFLSITGFVIWWLKRRHRVARRRAPEAPAPSRAA